MRIRLLSVGRPKDRPAIELHDRYAARLQHLGARYDSAWVGEVRAGGRYSDDHVLRREARLLLERAGEPGTLVALDRGGEALASAELARRLERWSVPQLTLAVGGPLGLHAELLERADFCWSLSAATLPHELARVVIVEQIYRALTLLRGVPYHK